MSAAQVSTIEGLLETKACEAARKGIIQGTPASHRWFALRVKSNFERTTAIHLECRGFEQFVPTYIARSRWSDRIKSVEKSLFPGYVFCRLNPEQRLPVLATPGVMHILGNGKEPIPVDQAEMESVWAAVHSGLLIRPWPFLQVGERVVLDRGPLVGLEGTVIQFKGTYRLAVSVSLLQRSIAVEIERGWIRPLGTKLLQH